MTSQPDQKAIAIHIFTNISRSEGNHAMKFLFVSIVCQDEDYQK